MHYKHYYCTGFCTFNTVLQPNGVFLNWLLSTATCILEQEKPFSCSLYLQTNSPFQINRCSHMSVHMHRLQYPKVAHTTGKQVFEIAQKF